MGRRIRQRHLIGFSMYILEKREVVLLIIPRENGLLALHLFSKINDRRRRRSTSRALFEFYCRSVVLRSGQSIKIRNLKFHVYIFWRL